MFIFFQFMQIHHSKLPSIQSIYKSIIIIMAGFFQTLLTLGRYSTTTQVLGWVWFFLLLITVVIWMMEYRVGYKREPKRKVVPPFDYFTRPIKENFDGISKFDDGILQEPSENKRLK